VDILGRSVFIGALMSMDVTNSLVEQRRAKLNALRARGIDPFRNKFNPSESCAQARTNYAEDREVRIAGRVTAHRDMGKSMFIDVRDQSGRLQVYAQKNFLGDDAFDVFRHIDLGDFIGVTGRLFTTKTGEISVKAASFVIVAKALRPPPEKWHGLTDTEVRYRQRYLDLMANPEVEGRAASSAASIIREIRNFLEMIGVMSRWRRRSCKPSPGGRRHDPSSRRITMHLGCDFYLRIALELYLKRLLVGGIDRVFEIGRNFRNEGLSRRHNPEFTMLEAYQAFGDYESMMELVAVHDLSRCANCDRNAAD
jgi:lysyl-tRNA synthetase, class II